MRPPMCALCHADLNQGGGLLHFALDERAQAWHTKADASPSFVGHPPEAEWFCAKHVEAARALLHLSRTDALTQLRAEGGRSPHPGPSACP